MLSDDDLRVPSPLMTLNVTPGATLAASNKLLRRTPGAAFPACLERTPAEITTHNSQVAVKNEIVLALRGLPLTGSHG